MASDSKKDFWDKMDVITKFSSGVLLAVIAILIANVATGYYKQKTVFKIVDYSKKYPNVQNGQVELWIGRNAD